MHNNITDILAPYIKDPNTIVDEVVNGPFVSQNRKASASSSLTAAGSGMA